jgi:hypothetical protein
MAVDHYAPCPCGSGKKLKFCKCVDNLQEFETISRLIEGGQELAALDRINQSLKKTPNAAWLLALKAELALNMDDDQLFVETATRFHKLKPDNPLALIMQSVACLYNNGRIEQASPYLLEGLAECRETIPGMAIFAMRELLNKLIVENRRFMGGFWEEFLADIAPSDEQAQLASPLNLVLRTLARNIEDIPPGTPWKERMDEVLALKRALRLEQAEKKLQSILRDYPDAALPLKRLLEAQYAKIDQQAAFATAQKLSRLPSLKLEERAFYFAVSVELDPDRSRLQVPAIFRSAVFEPASEKTERLASLPCLVDISAVSVEWSHSVFGEEIPPQYVYLILDSSPCSPDQQTAETDFVTYHTQCGFLAVFGKQTDKPAYAALYVHDEPAAVEQLDKICEILDLQENYPSKMAENLEILSLLSYSSYLTRERHLESPNGQTALSIEQSSRRRAEEFLAIRFKDLGGQTLVEAAQDETKRFEVLGLLTHLEGCHRPVMTEADMEEIYRRLGLQRPHLHIDAEKPVNLPQMWDITRVRIQEAPTELLRTLIYTARMFKLDRLAFQASQRVLDIGQAVDPNTALAAVMTLLSIEHDRDKLIELTHIGEQRLLELGNSPGEMLIFRFRLLAEKQEHEAASATLLEGAKKYPQDPAILAMMQMIMKSQQAASASASRFNDSSPAMKQGSGLVLPGGAATESAGESKLWIPGS